MKILLQRVSRARVCIEGSQFSAIGCGLLALVGFDRDDTPAQAERLLGRMLDYRIFPDAQQRMNCSVREAKGGVLLVSQFTLCADTGRGLRPGFSSAMPPQQASTLYAHCLGYLQQQHSPAAGGVFGADMQVELVNDGPVTFLLEG